MGEQLHLGVDPPRHPRAVNGAVPAAPEGWVTPRFGRNANAPTVGRDALVAFLDGWRACTITQVHEGSLDWPEKRVVVVLEGGAEIEVNNLAALLVRGKRKREVMRQMG